MKNLLSLSKSRHSTLFGRVAQGAAVSAFLMLPLAGCEVTKTEDGEMPDVDVQVEGGEMPEYDVDGPDVDVGTKEVVVEVPDVDVTMPDDPDYEEEDPPNNGDS